MAQDYGINLPRNLQIEMREEVQRITDEGGKELPSARIYEVFQELYVIQPQGRFKYLDHTTVPAASGGKLRDLEAMITDRGNEVTIQGEGTKFLFWIIQSMPSNPARMRRRFAIWRLRPKVERFSVWALIQTLSLLLWKHS